MKTLRTPKEILWENLKYGNKHSIQDSLDEFDSYVFKDHLVSAIKTAQKEAWNAAVIASAKAAKVKMESKDIGLSYPQVVASVDQDSILTLIEE